MNKREEELKKLRHSAAHLLAHAIMELFPDTKLTIGPATETGFFYDVLPSRNFKEDDLPLIEEKMRKLSLQDIPLTHRQISKDDARSLYSKNPFKLELIDNLEGDTVGLAEQGSFFDLCKGGHVESTGKIKHFKLTGISGSYWRADRDGTPLQRISGIAFLSKEEMEEDEKRKEDAIKYDHRRLGKQLDLFSFHDEGVGFPFFHHKGKIILNELRRYMRFLLKKADYKEIETPIMLSDELWRRSGHYEFYKNNMYFSNVDEKSYAVKPMNCPGAILIYKERPRSYRELPLRLQEFGRVHRHELSGVLHGLFRVRSFTIDDTHIFCTHEQIEHEVFTNISLIMNALKIFGFDNVKIALSTKPEKALGDEKTWENATNGLKAGLEKAGVEYTIQEGEGAFYGPKIEFHIKDSMDRQWQCGTLQLDFFQPENFDLTYVSPGGELKRPVICHQAIYGSLERFLGVLLEHHKGHLPFWLSPVQAKILTITDEQKDAAFKLLELLQEHNIRAEIDESSDTISGKIKDAQLQKIPWMIILGKKEIESKTITLRFADGSQESGISQEELVKKSKEMIPF